MIILFYMLFNLGTGFVIEFWETTVIVPIRYTQKNGEHK